MKFNELKTPENSGSISSALSVPASHNSRTTTGSAGSFAPSVAVTDTDISDGKVWAITERIRGKCLQGEFFVG